MYRRVDLAAVLVACWCLDDEERRTALLAELDDVRRAYLTAYAMWDGKALERHRGELLGRLATAHDDAPDTDAIIAAAHAYLDAAPRPSPAE